MFPLRYEKFYQHLIKNEGWISNDEYDYGGHTIVGISKKSFPVVHDFVQQMIEDDFQREHINQYIKLFYYLNFYNPLYDKVIDSSLAFRIFDFGVNAGVRKSVKLLQKTCNKWINERISVDGIFGKETLSTTNQLSHSKDQYKETNFYYDYVERLEKYYKSLWNFFRFGEGWLNRLKNIFNKSPNLEVKK